MAAISSVNYDHIELTEEELATAIHQAKGKKAAMMNEIAYARKIREPKQYPKFDFETLQKYVLSKHPGYVIDDSNREIFETLCLYFSNDPAFELQGDGFSMDKGIMLYGPVGCGKTSLMKMFAINSFKPFAIASCRSVADSYAVEGSPALYRYAALQPVFPEQNFGLSEIGRCFDDLGTEDDKKNFGNQVNVMQDILFKVYDAGLKGNFHLTTNIIGDQIEDQYGARIRSRMREMFNVLIFDETAPDRRK